MSNPKKTLKKVVYSRGIIFCFLILLQISILLETYFFFSKYAVWVFEILKILAVLIIIYIINDDDNAMYKIAWIIPILVVPVIGTLLYLYVQINFLTAKIQKKYTSILKKTKEYITQDKRVLHNIDDSLFLSTVKYLDNVGFNTYQNTQTKYLEIGEVFFDSLKKDLENAKEFIFLEYFIISDNYMWNEILEILKRKVQDGVEVRVMYDGFGSLITLPVDYNKYLNSIGIKCQIFFPVKPILSTYQNTRDHRKIAVIDNRIGYTGGINLSDEYINRVVRRGHWKDTACRIEGSGVKSLTLMFLQLWDVFNKKESTYKNYLIEHKANDDGLVCPFGDNSFDNENVGEQVYLDIINSAVNYVYITTPYLMLDGEMINALKHAVKRDVDVRILLPHISDGKGTREVATSYYLELIKAGIKIYEYDPGFIHAKMFVSDDIKAVVGTINLDYRSLYLHFENGVLFYKSSLIKDIKDDVIKTIDKSTLITEKNFKKIPVMKRAIGRILRLIAPLM